MSNLMIKPELLKILACPGCKGELDYVVEQGKLVCKKCRLKYSVEKGVPIMLIDQAEKF